jgi:hypothetical protein
LGRAFRNHWTGLVLILALVAAALVALAAAAVVAQRDDRAPAKEPQASLGIDPTKGTCPKAEPEKLPPDALAGATEVALDQVPEVFGDTEANEGAYAVSASREGNRIITRGFGCGKLLRERSVTVNLIFPKMLPSASLSQHTVFVAKFEGEYRVWGAYR